MRNNTTRNLRETIIDTNKNRNTVLLLSLAVLVLLFISLAWPFMFSFRLGILAQQARFKSESFEQVSVSGITDGNGTLVFVDKDLKVVYPLESTLHFTQNDIDTMVDVEMVSQDINEFSYIEDNITYTRIESEGLHPRTSWYVVIDELGNYIESNNFHYIQASYSDEEINYIKNDYVKDARTYKYYFVSDAGNEYHMIVSLDSKIVLYETYEIVILLSIVLISAILIIILVKRPTKKLSEKLNQPIKDLSLAMERFTPGEPVFIEQKYDVLEYDSIVNSFNRMILEINRLEEDNKSLERKRKNMFAAITHDLKTPITVLNGYVNALITNRISKDEIDTTYEKILKNTDKLTKLINEFVSFNEMEHSNFTLKLEQVDISEYIRTYFAENYQYIDDNQCNLIVDIPEVKLSHRIDHFQFAKALDNILSNFIKYNPINTTIHIKIKESIDEIYIILENNGTKINDEISVTLFDPFIIDDEARTTSSTGLGLSITKKIIELHNGTIRYNSTEEYCNQFVITLKKE